MLLSELMAYKAKSKASPGWVCRTKIDKQAYPYRSVTGKKKVSLTVMCAFVLAKNNENHLVVISVRQRSTVNEKDYRIWCSDQFLEGQLKSAPGEDPVLDRCKAAAKGLPNEEELILEMQGHAGMVPHSEKCDFWQNYKGPDKKLCEHTEHVLASMFTEQLGIEMAEALDNRLGISGSAPTGTTAGNTALSRFVFRVPVLIEGDRGSGKTHEARALAEAGGYPLIEVPGHEGVEASDLLGHLVPMPNKTLAWKDGGLSQAFRLAASGVKTYLLVDEVLRIPQRQLSVMLTALSDNKGYYTLRTGRVIDVKDGVGTEEVLRCMVANLAVVATTNVGAEYAVDQIDPAFAERWMILRKDTTVESLQAVLNQVAAKKGFSSDVTAKLIKFFDKAKDLKHGNQIVRTPTTRTLVRAMELADREQDVKEMVIMQALLWVGRDLEGFPEKAQQESLKKIANSIFAGSRT